MANEIDELMDRDPLGLSKADLEKIIAYQRSQKIQFDSGVKPKKETAPKQKISLAELGLAPVADPVKRRKLS